MSDSTTAIPAPAPPNGAAVRHLLSAVHEALTLPAPAERRGLTPYLMLLERRATVARASVARLLADPLSDALDFISEGDHILHQIADLRADSYRHRRP